jgi:hypothetical protein
MPVAGLDLARRSDHSALVLLDVEHGRLTVTAALRLPQAPLRQQFALIAPHLAGLDLLVFDQGGLEPLYLFSVAGGAVPAGALGAAGSLHKPEPASMCSGDLGHRTFWDLAIHLALPNGR